MKKLYAVSLMAHKDIKTEEDGWWWSNTIDMTHTAAYFTAVSRDEADGKAARLCKESFPEEDGWIKHSISVLEIKNDK